jgi:hypothetical protein
MRDYSISILLKQISSLIIALLFLPSLLSAATFTPIDELTFTKSKSLMFDLMAGAYAYVEPKGVRDNIPGRPGQWPAGEDIECVTRMMEAMGSWLSISTRPTSISTQFGTLNIEEMMRKALVNGSNPNSGVSWSTTHPQMNVESATIAWATWLSGNRVLSKMTSSQINNLITFLNYNTYRNVNNNYNCFFLVTNSVLKKKNWNYNSGALTTCMNKIESYYRGNGWYTDGDNVPDYDDYNSWVFHTHMPQWCILQGDSDPNQRNTLMSRMSLYLQDQVYLFSQTGGHPEWGRSAIYRFARLGALITAYYLDRTYNTPDKWNLGYTILPQTISTGMLRRLIRLHLNHFISDGSINFTTRILNQRLTPSGSMSLPEDYIGPGSVYWALRALGVLMLLNDNDPIWSTTEESLPSETASFNKWIPSTGFLISSVQGENQTLLFNCGSTFPSGKQYAAKYCKFVYSSQHGYILKQTAPYSPDNMIQIKVGSSFGHRTSVGSYFLQSSNITSAVFALKHLQTAGSIQFNISSIIFIKGNSHIRVHKIEPVNYTGSYTIREAGFCLGKQSTGDLSLQTDPQGRWTYASSSKGAVMVGRLQKFDNITNDIPSDEKAEGSSTLNSRFAYYQLPYAQTQYSQYGQTITAIYVKGTKDAFDPAASFASINAFSANSTGATISFSDNTTLTGTFDPYIPGDDTLLSKNKSISASSNEAGNVPSNAVDGSMSTRWAASSISYPQWIKVDLGAIKSIGRCDIAWYSTGTARAYKYQIAISNDNSNFTTIIDKSSNTTPAFNTSDNIRQTGRWVRINITGSTAGWASLFEMQVYGKDTTIISQDTLLSRNRSASSSSVYQSYYPSNAFDGNFSTRWSASTISYPQWIKVDLGAIKSIGRCDISWYNTGSARAYKYKIELSNDNGSYTAIIDKSGNTTPAFNTSDIINRQGRWVRLTITGSSAGWASIFEMQVFGKD